ncbi:MAG: hypothetical protein METHP_00262 [Methanoregula sp. SKADARSKE-2]|nr:MAG: hypothetical protein METHP_00262 [Methanoregula sp. SKADARSKE-2]
MYPSGANRFCVYLLLIMVLKLGKQCADRWYYGPDLSIWKRAGCFPDLSRGNLGRFSREILSWKDMFWLSLSSLLPAVAGITPHVLKSG